MTKKWTNAAVWKWCDLDGHPHDNVVSRHELFPVRAPLQVHILFHHEIQMYPKDLINFVLACVFHSVIFNPHSFHFVTKMRQELTKAST